MPMDPKSDDKFALTLSDIWRLCRRSKRKIVTSMIFLGFIGGLMALTNKVEYRVEGTFREKSTKPVSLGSSLAAAFMSSSGFSGGQDSESISFLKSRKMLEKVIRKLHLQAIVYPKSERDSYLRRIKENFLVELAYLLRSPYPILKDNSHFIGLEDIHYEGEIPLLFQISLRPDGSYELTELLSRRPVGQGQLNQLFQHEDFQFTVVHNSGPLLPNEKYWVTLLPLPTTAMMLSRKLLVEADKGDKSLLKIAFQDRDRHFACEVVNTLMDCYKQHLKENHDEQAALQLGYLQRRQEESGDLLADLMRKHANTMSEDFSANGFADSRREMDFLAESQREFKEKLLSNELEIKRLQNVQAGRCVYYDRYHTNDGDPAVINRTLEEIRRLRQHRDFLELALKKSTFLDKEEMQTLFEHHMDELRNIQVYIDEIKVMLEDYKAGKPFDYASPLMQDSRFLVKTWYERLTYHYPNYSADEEAQFLSYLKNLYRLFLMHEKTIKERLTHQQSPSLEFEGIQLQTAEELYILYTKQLNELENRIQHYDFLIKQLQDPQFDISSLSTSLDDVIALEMIRQAGQLLIQLRDENNRTSKEHERIKAELALQKNFLSSHIQQLIKLAQISEKILQEKIFSLQNVTLELIHQQVSLLEKNLNDYIDTRLENLRQERKIIQQHLKELHQEMAKLPLRWVSEQLIQQRVDNNQLIVKEIAKLVESRNITHNLEVIQSAPVDGAIPPLHPIPSSLMLYAILGSLLGGCLTVGFVLARSMIRGIPASVDNLRAQNLHVAGELTEAYYPQSTTPLHDQDLETLRRLQAYFSESASSNSQRQTDLGRALLMIEGRGHDYAPDLAMLLIKKGFKVLTISLSFDGSNLQENGLLQYLEGKISFPEITHQQDGDHIKAGGMSRFAAELLNTQPFVELLEKLKARYDWILATTRALPATAEAESLASLFSNIVVTIDQETLPEIESYLQLAQDPSRKISFVIVNMQWKKQKKKESK